MLNSPIDFEEFFSVNCPTPPHFSKGAFLQGLVTSLPFWVKFALFFRSKTLGLVGFKEISAANFSLLSVEDDAVSADFNDNYFSAHLNLFWSEPDKILSMRVQGHFHHWAGKLYFLAIKPCHRLIFNQILEAIARRVNER
jgi:hypothetical protein